MSNLNKILIRSGNQWLFWCPGCLCLHGPNDTWKFNGDQDKPSFAPSVLSTGEKRCHLYVVNGQLQFLADCEHDFAGKTVDMEVAPWNREDSGQNLFVRREILRLSRFQAACLLSTSASCEVGGFFAIDVHGLEASDVPSAKRDAYNAALKDAEAKKAAHQAALEKEVQEAEAAAKLADAVHAEAEEAACQAHVRLRKAREAAGVKA